MAQFTAGVVDTGGKFATGVRVVVTGVVDTSRIFVTGIVDTVAVSPLNLRISLQNLEKSENDPHVIFRGFGEVDELKKHEAKIS